MLHWEIKETVVEGVRKDKFVTTLSMPPEFVHVAFTKKLAGSQADKGQKFGIIGNYGNSITIYETESFLVQHQIMVNNIVKSFMFANNNQDLLVVTKDCKVRIYSLIDHQGMCYEGIFLREIANCHRGAITGLDVSQNSGYLLTGGEDNMLRIWDYEATNTNAYFFQSFIGHTYPLSSLIFNPCKKDQIISIGREDGIFIWEFNGDVDTDYNRYDRRVAG